MQQCPPIDVRDYLSDKWSIEQCRSGTGRHFRTSFVRAAFCARFVHKSNPAHGLLDSASQTALVAVLSVPPRRPPNLISILSGYSLAEQ
jgi:hypothetical protein